MKIIISDLPQDKFSRVQRAIYKTLEDQGITICETLENEDEEGNIVEFVFEVL